MLISFSGIDGCGKTTFATQVMELLKQKGLKAKYLRVTDMAVSRKLGELFKKISSENTKKAASSSGSISSFFRKMFLVFDVLFFRVVLLCAGVTGTSIVCDRYFFDSIVHLKYLGISTKLFDRFLFVLAPEPDMAFLLVVPAEVAIGRDKDFSAEFYREKHSYYMEVFKKINAIKIENNNLDSTSMQVEKVVVEYLQEKR